MTPGHRRLEIKRAVGAAVAIVQARWDKDERLSLVGLVDRDLSKSKIFWAWVSTELEEAKYHEAAAVVDEWVATATTVA